MILNTLCFLIINPFTIAIALIIALKRICDEEERNEMESK